MCQPGRPRPHGDSHAVLIGLGRLPEREVDRVALVLAGLHPRAGAQLVGLLPRELAVGREGAHREVDVAARLVRVAGDDQLGDQADDLSNRLGGQRLVVGPADAEPVGVVDVRLGHLGGQCGRRDPALVRQGIDLLVDVGDVLDKRHRLAAPLEVALHETEHDERASVAHMDAAIDGRPADVHPDPPVGAGYELERLAGAGVADPHAALRMASSRGSAANTAQSSGPRSRPVSTRRACRSGTCERRSSSTSSRARGSSSRSG